MAYLKIVDPQWAGYSDMIGLIEFENGVSKEHVGRSEIDRIAAIMKVVEVDENGDERPSNPTQKIIDMSRTGAPVEKPLERQGKLEDRTEILPKPLEISSDKKPETDEIAEKTAAIEKIEQEIEQQAAERDTKEVKTYNREELEAIADEKGISGLRKIGDPLNIKSNSVEGLMDKIINTQGNG